MEPIGITGVIVGGLVVLGALLLKLWGRAQYQRGRVEERNEQNRQAAEAIRRAEDVLAEHRNPDDVAERLRRGDF